MEGEPKQNNINEEKREKSPALGKIVDRHELSKLVYQGHSLPQDKRFRGVLNGGVFKYFHPEDLNSLEHSLHPDLKEVYATAEQDGLVVGIGKLRDCADLDNVMEVWFISVDPQFQDEGHASVVARTMFEYAKTEGAKIATSSYSKDGWEKLKPLFNKLAGEVGVEFIDTESTIR